MSPTGLAPLPTTIDGKPEHATAKVYNRWGDEVVVYNVPLPIARWIAESFYDLDYIQVSDIADLATFAARHRRMDQELFDSEIAHLESEHAMFAAIDDANIGEYLGPSSSW